MRRVDKAPAVIDRRMVEEPSYRPGARPGEAVFDFLHLLGDMDVDRTVAGDGDDLGKLLRRHRAQAMRRNTDRFVGSPFDGPPAVLNQTLERVDVGDEPPLFRLWRRPAECR